MYHVKCTHPHSIINGNLSINFFSRNHLHNMPRKTTFNDDWMINRPWLKQSIRNSNDAICSFCNSTFSLSNMGLQAIKSHEKGKKHQGHEKKRNLSSGQTRITQFSRAQSVSSSSQPSDIQSTSSTNPQSSDVQSTVNPQPSDVQSTANPQVLNVQFTSSTSALPLVVQST